MKRVKGLFYIGLMTLVACAAFWRFYPDNPTFRERTLQGHTMTQWLNILRSNTNSADNPLKIVQIMNEDKFGNVEIEVPVSYDLLVAYGLLETNGWEQNGRFDLILNSRVLSPTWWRANNGNCIVGCDANDFTPGTNQIQVQLLIFGGNGPAISATGPVAEFVSSNVCRVNEQVTRDYAKEEADFWADLSITNASYNIELLDNSGNHIKTISGITTNDYIDEHWDLIGDSGKHYSFDSFIAVFHIALPKSLSQTNN